jgi:23S rRNA (guanine745-N1)-methyltransferase
VLADVVALLRCPTCGAALHADGGSLRCPAGHTFDVARQGYVNLLAGGGHGSADTAAMVRAREEFLGAGHYEPLADAVAAAAGEGGGPVVEVGAGTAYYLAHVLGRRPASVGVAVDVSVPAARRAARAHPRAGSVVADAWAALPLADGCAEVVLVVFAPRGAGEIARVLRPGGRLVVLTPTPAHLGELVGPLGLLGVDDRKPERLHDALAPWFDVVTTTAVTRSLRLPAADVERLAGMGPSAFHTTPDELRRRVGQLPEPVEVTASATVTTLRRR